jgi:hypothetical protein
MLPVDLETRQRGLVLGIELRLLQMVWASGQASALSASTSALLELAASLLSRLSASRRSAFSSAATSKLRSSSAATTNSLCSASTAAAGTSAGLLVLYQR